MSSQTFLFTAGESDASKPRQFTARAVASTITIAMMIAFVVGFAFASIGGHGSSLPEVKSPEVVQLSTANMLKVNLTGMTNLYIRLGGKPFFNRAWQGDRNDWDGDVGMRFSAKKTFFINALGRSCVRSLKETVTVTLWSSATRGALASVNVGPGSPRKGSYAYTKLKKPIRLEVGSEYRISAQCHKGMTMWPDHDISSSEIAKGSESDYATFYGSCYRSGFGYPHANDGHGRRPGMLNFLFVEAKMCTVPASIGCSTTAAIQA